MQEPDSNLSAVRLVTVEAGEAGQRVDNFLMKRAHGVPKGHIYRIIRTGQVRVDGGRCKPTRKLLEGEVVRIPPLRTVIKSQPSVPDELAERIAQRVIYHNDDFFVLDKPAGLAVHGGSGLAFGLIDALRQTQQNNALELVHRIDKGTSGCLLVAKNNGVNRQLQNLFRERQVDKRYSALVCGQWPGLPASCDAPLLKNQDNGGQKKVLVSHDGQSAVSHFAQLERYEDATLVDVAIETGRTHQIRVHAQYLGHALVGDDRYGRREDNRRFANIGLAKRLYLHARELQFEWQGERITVVAKPDVEWQASLDSLTRA